MSEEKKINLAIAGDIALHGIISSQKELTAPRYEWLGSALNRYSGVFANLEVPVEGTDRNPGKKSVLYSDYEVTAEILKLLNIKCVSLANNHILDCGRDGLENTIKLLDESGIAHTGAGTEDEHIKPACFTIDGRRAGVIAYVDTATNPKTDAFPGLHLNIYSEEKVIKDIKSIKGSVDFIICSLHWGVDYSYYPRQWQVEAARRFVDAGADIIAGHHSHTLQPYEKYRSGIIFYGLGSLTFGDFLRNGQMYALFRKTKHSAVFGLNGNNDITGIIPVREKKGNYIVEGRRNITARNSRLWKVYLLAEANRGFRYLLSFHESVVYRVYEYFFGYYMNPVKRIFQFGNIRKFKRLFN